MRSHARRITARILPLLALAALPALAQTAASLSPEPNLQFLDTTTGIGLPCVSCTLKTYAAGTNTPLRTYTDSSGTTQNQATITLNSQGYSTSGIWLGGSCYKYVLAKASGATIWTQDNICDSGQLLKASLATTTGAGMVGFSQSSSYASGTVGSKLKTTISVKDNPFNATGDGSTDDTSAIRSATSFLCGIGGGTLYFPYGTFIIAPTVAANPILTSCSNMTVSGPGTIKIKNSAGSYYSIWGISGTPLSNFHLDGSEGLTINMNSANNPVPSSGDLATYPRIVLHTGNGGSNDSASDCHVTDIRSEWVFFMASPKSSVTNCLLDNVGGGSVQYDSSLIYTEYGAPDAVISENRIVASARNANLAISGIETHSSATITSNTITDMLSGMNITGYDSSTTVGTAITGNRISGAFGGMKLWSGAVNGATTYGQKNTILSGNTVTINQLSYTSAGGAAYGIILDQHADLPFANMKINNNIVTFDLSSSSGDPYDTASIGIGYWDADDVAGCQGCDFSNNSVINAPSNAFRYSAKGSNIHFDNNTAINPGSNLNSGLNSSFRAGLFLSNTAAVTNISVKGGSYVDTLATSRFGYGIELATVNTSGIVIDGVAVSCADVTCASLVKAITPNTNTQLPYVRAILNVPSSKVLPVNTLALRSSIYSAQEGINYVWDGTSYTYMTPHPGTPVASGDCGVTPTVVGTDRAGRILLGAGATTSCTMTFALAFSQSVYGSVQLITNVGAPTFTTRSPVALTGFVVGGTNLSGNIFEWSFPLAN